MKPRNFPARIYQRRVEAIERLEKEDYKQGNEKAITNTKAKIKHQTLSEQRSVRTKKDRS